MVWWFHILPFFMQIQTKQITSKLTIITCSQKWHLYSSKTWSDTTGIMCIQQRKGHTNINFILFQIGQKLWDALNRGKFCWDWWYLDMKIKFTLHNQMAKSSISSCISKTFEDKSNHAKISLLSIQILEEDFICVPEKLSSNPHQDMLYFCHTTRWTIQI